jgi:tetratricopeptide (TPR) repeat protein
MSIICKLFQYRKEIRWLFAFIGFLILIARSANLLSLNPSLENALINIFVSTILLGSLLKDLVFPEDFQDLLQDLAVSFVFGISLVIITALIVLVVKGSMVVLLLIIIVTYCILLILDLLVLINKRQLGLFKSEGSIYRNGKALFPKNIDPEALALFAIFLLILSVGAYWAFSNAVVWRTIDSWAFLAYIRKYLDTNIFDPNNTIIVNLDSRVSFSAWLVVLTYIIKLSQDFSVSHYFLYLTPIFAFIAIASFYTFAVALFKDKKIALFATCIQMIYFASSLMYDAGNLRGAGYALVDSIAEDKYFSVWVIMPIVLMFAWRFFESRKWRDFAFFALTATSATMVHPISYASIGLVLGSYLTISFVWILILTIKRVKRNLKSSEIRFRFFRILSNEISTNKALFRAVLLSLLFLVFLIPYLMVAKIDYESGGSKGFNIEEAVEGEEVVIDRLSNRHLVFYSISSYRADTTLLLHPIMILSICLSPLLIKFFDRENTARYLFGGLVIPLLLIYNPWTAPLMGKLITATQIWRLSWSFPFSLTLGYVLYQYLQLFISKASNIALVQPLNQSQFYTENQSGGKFRMFFDSLSPLLIIIILILLFPKIKEGIAYIEDRKGYYVVSSSEIQVGEFFRFNGGAKKNTLTDEITARTLLGVTSDINIIRYRTQWPHDPELDNNMDYLFRSASILDSRIVEFLNNYSVEYLVIRSNLPITEFFHASPSIAELVYENEEFGVYQISSQLIDSYAAQGDFEYLNNDLISAEVAYRNALVEEFNNPFPYLGLGRIYLESGDRRQAIEYFQEAINLSSENKQVLDIVATKLKVDVNYVINYIRAGENYQTPAPANVVFNFLNNLNDAIMISPDNQIYIRRDVFVNNNQPFGVLFQHAPSQVTYELDIPARAWLQFTPAVAPEVWQLGKGDGVQFNINLETTDNRNYRLYNAYLDPKNLVYQRKLVSESISLSQWADETVTFTFNTSCGPNNDCRYDWAGWGEPRIVQPIAYDFLANLSSAVLEDGVTEDQVRQDTFSIDNEQRQVLFIHPTNRVSYSLNLPDQSVLAFGIGMDPEVWSPDHGDGVDYKVFIRPHAQPTTLYQVFHRYIDPKNHAEDRRWFDELVDLSQFGGQLVDLIFEAGPGPEGNLNFDRGGWSSPVLLDNSMSGLNN